MRGNNFIYTGISLNKDCCQLKDSGEKNNYIGPNQSLEAWKAKPTRWPVSAYRRFSSSRVCVLDQSPCWNMAWSAPEDWSRWDPEKLLVCPYDEVHRIKAKRFQKHLLKCRENHPEKDFVTCPFNAKHVMLRSEFRHHVSRCPDRVSRSQIICYEHLLCELFRYKKVSLVFILLPMWLTWHTKCPAVVQSMLLLQTLV